MLSRTAARERADALPDLSKSMELVHSFQAGRSAALDELFERYMGRLRRIVSIRMGAALRSREEVDDLVQETYIVAMRRIGDFEPHDHTSILRWLSKIAEYQIKARVEYHGAEKRTPGRETPIQAGEGSESAPGIDPAATGPTPSALVLRAEFEELIDSYVQELEPEDFREAIIQRDYYEADWEDIRQRLDRPTVAATRELYRRAHAKLKQKLLPHLARSQTAAGDALGGKPNG